MGREVNWAQQAIPRKTRSEVKEWAGDVGSGNAMDEAADRLSNMSIDSNGSERKRHRTLRIPPDCHYSLRWRYRTPGATVSSSDTGPSSTSIVPSASTTATSAVPLSTSIMSIDSNPSQSFGDESSSSSALEVNERITVKIADLGNGMSSLHLVAKLC
jgi:hypothetical protein